MEKIKYSSEKKLIKKKKETEINKYIPLKKQKTLQQKN